MLDWLNLDWLNLDWLNLDWLNLVAFGSGSLDSFTLITIAFTRPQSKTMNRFRSPQSLYGVGKESQCYFRPVLS